MRPRLRVDNIVLRDKRRPTLATTTIRVGTSYAPLDLWYVDLDVRAGARGSCRHWLSDDELGRAERFHSDLDRSRYVVGRIALRRVLADRLGCSPAAVRFSYGRNGKPMLEGARGHLEFNLAHCGGDAVIALTECAAVRSDDELGRAERFHSDLDRSRYVVGRIALRRVLADRLGCSPAAVRFSYGRNGKPMLEGARGHLEFNLAHCGGDAVIALTECAAVRS